MSQHDGTRAEFAVIGGSGFYDMPGLEGAEQIDVQTPWGDPSSPVTLGTLHGRRVAFIARHGEGHRLLPGEVPSRANIYALKTLGVERVLAVAAVGSLQAQIEPQHAVVPDQLIDRTKARPSSFFGDGAVANVAFADPFCPDLSAALGDAAGAEGVTAHRGGTMVVMEGPAFSTRAESDLYRSWGGSIIGMTALPEAKLAREAELCYASLCLVTDYDVWHEDEADVSVELILANLQQNVSSASAIVGRLIAAFDETSCSCRDALGEALVTSPDLVPESTRRRLDALVTRYWGPAP